MKNMNKNMGGNFRPIFYFIQNFQHLQEFCVSSKINKSAAKSLCNMPIAMYLDLWYNYYSKEKELLSYE